MTGHTVNRTFRRLPAGLCISLAGRPAGMRGLGGITRFDDSKSVSASTLQRRVAFDYVVGIGEVMDELPEIIEFCASDRDVPVGGHMPTACSRSGQLGPATLSWIAPGPGEAQSGFFRSRVDRRAPVVGTIDDLPSCRS